jgi:hypothetical protein
VSEAEEMREARSFIVSALYFLHPLCAMTYRLLLVRH